MSQPAAQNGGRKERDSSEGSRLTTGPPVWWHSLLVRQTVFVAAVVVLAVSTVGHLAYLFARNIIQDDVRDRLQVVAVHRAALLETYARQQYERAALLTNRTRLRELLGALHAGLRTIDDAAFRQEVADALQTSIGDTEEIRTVAIADLEGRLIASTGENVFGRSLAKNHEFLVGRTGRHLGMPHFEEGRYVLALSAPVLNAEAHKLGVLVARVDAAPLMRALMDRNGLGTTGEIQVAVRSQGQITFLLPHPGGGTAIETPSASPSLEAALAGHSGTQTEQVAGRDVLTIFQPVSYELGERTAAGLEVQIDLAEAYVPARRLRHLLWTMQVILALAGAVGSFLLARRFTRPMLELASTASRIAAGDLQARASVQSQDEIGTMAAAFNRMTEQVVSSYGTLEHRVGERTQALLTSEKQMRSILNSAHEAFIAIDERSSVVDWNVAAEETFGWSKQEVIGRQLPELIIPPGTRESHRRGLAHFLATGEGPVFHKRLELTAVHRDGHSFPVEVTIAHIPETRLFTAFLHDITERKASEVELRFAREKAEAASRSKSAFLANMSHEIRTPMNAIIGMTGLMLDTPLSRTQREYLTMVQESGESLLSLINDILDFSKIEAGRMDLESAAFDLRDNVGDTMKSLAIRAHRKGLELACHVAPGVPEFVEGDRFRLRQILINLVGNAIKFTEAGEVVVEVTCEACTDEVVLLHFVVRDTGIGIPPEKQALIFEAFEQADESMARRFQGTGLGLTISSRLVELMQGRIWVESEVGQGSRFHFTAQFGPVAEADVIAAPPSPRGTLRDLRVLVVDDNATNRSILAELLRNWKMRATTAASGAEALRLLREAKERGETFPLILTDAHMPDMDGFEFASQIRGDADLQGMIILMLTSDDRAGDAARRAELGIQATLMKPVKQSELFDAIAAVLGGGDEDTSTAAPAPAVRTALPLHILLAEDSLVNQTLALTLLERSGHTVSVANNGQEAVAKLALQPFDLVLMDVQMPAMDGLEATAAIRARERETGKHVPIIAMTAHAMKGDREVCLESGMDGYISKPIHPRELYDTIAEVLQQQPAKEAAPPAPACTADDHAHADNAAADHPATPHDLDSPAFDHEAALDRVEGREEALQQLARLFLDECPRWMGEIESGLTTHDLPTLRRAAHTLKGSADIFAAHPVVDAALRLELMAQEGDLKEAPEAWSHLQAEVDRLIREIRELLAVQHA